MSLFKEINSIKETQVLDKKPKLDMETLSTDKENPISKDNVDNIIKGAHDKENEEVETVTFGLETEDNEIVKVYVNATDADGFEEAMSKMLGQEDSIEDALEKLSHEYDIVDVEWPDEDDEEEDDEEEMNDEDGMVAKDDEDMEAGPIEPMTQKEGEDMTIGNQFLKKILGEAKKPADGDAEFELFDVTGEGGELIDSLRLATPYQKKIMQVILLSGFPVETLKMKRSTLRKNIVETSRVMLKDANIRIWFQRFAKELAKMKGAEMKKEDKKKDEETEVEVKEALISDDLAAKKIFDKIKGTPNLNVANVEKLVRKYLTMVSKAETDVKYLTAKVYDMLKETDLAESIDSVGTVKDDINNKLQLKLVDLWSYLGVPEALLKMRKAELKQSLRQTAVELQRSSRAKTYLGLLIDGFGGGDKRNFDRKIEEELELVTEVAASNDPYIQQVLELITLLGLPNDNLSFKQSQIIRALRDKKMTLTNLNMIRSKMQILADVINKNTKQKTTQPAEVTEGRKIPRLTPAEAKSVISFALDGHDMMDSAWDKVYEYFMERMPYGTMKGRSGDPMEWVGDYFSIDAKVKTAQDVADELDSIWPENMNESILSEMAKRGRPPKKKPLPTRGTPANTNDAQDDLSLDDEDETAVDKDVEKTKKVRMTKTIKLNPTDLGDWSVGDLGAHGGMMLKSRAFAIKLADTEVEKLVDAIGDNKVIVVKSSTGKKYSFRPYRMGSKNVYIVKQLDDTKYPDGVLLPTTSVEAVLDHQFK